MGFTEAYEAMRYDGKKVCRECWKDGTYLRIIFEAGIPRMKLSKLDKSGKRHEFYVRELTISNIFAEDWRVIDE